MSKFITATERQELIDTAVRKARINYGTPFVSRVRLSDSDYEYALKMSYDAMLCRLNKSEIFGFVHWLKDHKFEDYEVACLISSKDICVKNNIEEYVYPESMIQGVISIPNPDRAEETITPSGETFLNNVLEELKTQFKNTVESNEKLDLSNNIIATLMRKEAKDFLDNVDYGTVPQELLSIVRYWLDVVFKSAQIEVSDSGIPKDEIISIIEEKYPQLDAEFIGECIDNINKLYNATSAPIDEETDFTEVDEPEDSYVVEVVEKSNTSAAKELDEEETDFTEVDEPEDSYVVEVVEESTEEPEMEEVYEPEFVSVFADEKCIANPEYAEKVFKSKYIFPTEFKNAEFDRNQVVMFATICKEIRKIKGFSGIKQNGIEYVDFLADTRTYKFKVTSSTNKQLNVYIKEYPSVIKYMGMDIYTCNFAIEML